MSNDDDTLPQQQQSSITSRTPESIQKFLYDEKGKLRADIVSVLGRDKNYVLLEKGLTREKKVKAILDYIAPRSGTEEKWNADGEDPKSNTTSSDASNLRIFTKWNTHRAAAATNRLLEHPMCKLI